jgi:DNA-binding response OmpR family regulator
LSSEQVVVVASDVALGNLVASVLRRGHMSVAGVISSPSDLSERRSSDGTLVVGHVSSDSDLRLLRATIDRLDRPPVLILLADTAGTPQIRALEGFATDLLRLPASPDHIVDLVRVLAESRNAGSAAPSNRGPHRIPGGS